ncbi:repressor LexA, partial [Phocea massiliensis]
AEEGDIVVALVDNETTLKRFYRDKKHRCCRLHPENSKMKDIYVQDCTIQGVAQNVIKAL